MLEDLRERGMAHEKAYLDWLRGKGLAVADAVETRRSDNGIDEMRAGVDVIYQAALGDDEMVWDARISC